MAKILVVEDEPKVAGALKEGLETEGYEVVLAHTGEEGFFHANSNEFRRSTGQRYSSGSIEWIRHVHARRVGQGWVYLSLNGLWQLTVGWLKLIASTCPVLSFESVSPRTHEGSD